MLGFYRVSSGKWTNKSFLYELDNVFGALFLIIYQLRYGAYISVVLNAVWGGIAMLGIIRFLNRYHSHTKTKSKRKKR